MSDIESVDKTGASPSLSDVEEACAVVRKYIVMGILKLPPELAVQLPNIDRCLSVAETAIRFLKVPR